MGKAMKLIGILLSIVIIVIIINPNNFESRSTSEGASSAVEPPFHPNAVAKSLTATPGAIVCADLASVSLVFRLYANHWEYAAQDASTNGQSNVLRGPTAPAPDPKLYGCSLLIPGTPVYVENADAFTTGIPKVLAKLPDGTMVHGVTLPSMLSRI